MIPYGRQDITQQDIDAVIEVLKSDYLTQGPKVAEFEDALCSYTGAKHAVVVSSATSALHIACFAMGLKPGDWLWTSPITFVASANCALYCGAHIDFVDIDSRTYNICPGALEEKLIRAEKAGKLPKIVVPVHLAGQSCDMDAIKRLSEKYGFKIIEDASHAIGGRYKGETIGSGRFSDVTIFSFHPVKIITTGEGGAALTNDEELAAGMALLRTHGITRDSARMIGEADGPWYYQQVLLGFNYRMTDIQAALGISQMKRLDQYVACRQEMARHYDRMLVDLPVITPWQRPEAYSSFHLYIIRIVLDKVKVRHRTVFERMREQGVGVNLHYIPVHLQPHYQKFGFKKGSFPEAEKYYGEAISLPIYPSMDAKSHEYVVNTLRAALNG